MVWWDELSPAERAAADDCLGLIANPRLREGVERYVAALNAMRNLMGWGSTDKPTVSDAVAALNAVMVQARHEERNEGPPARDAVDDLLAGKVFAVERRVGRCMDVALVQQALTREKEGKNRQAVVKALAERVALLAEPDMAGSL